MESNITHLVHSCGPSSLCLVTLFAVRAELCDGVEGFGAGEALVDPFLLVDVHGAADLKDGDEGLAEGQPITRSGATRP